MVPESNSTAEISEARLQGAGGLPLGAASTLPLVEELPRHLQPWDVFERLQGFAHLLFLDSALPRTILGRYSFLCAEPFAWLTSHRGEVVVNSQGIEQCSAGDPFAVLAGLLRDMTSEPVAGLPPFQGGAAGLFGYDLCHHLERLPRPRRDEFAVPDLAVGFYDWVIAFDHVQSRGWLISTGYPEWNLRARRRRAAERLRNIQRRLSQEAKPNDVQVPPKRLVSPHDQFPVPGLPHITSSFTRAGYLEAARRVVEYVHAGDCFQVNLAQRLLHPAIVGPGELYRRLRERNPATFSGYFDLGDYVIASASPERFLRVERGQVETRPIKGTRPRGTTPAEDCDQVQALSRSAKDRAENIMIVDLLRNDLGRVCAYGTVQVPALCRVESYPFVHHLVSEVRGRLRPDCGPIDLLRAAFPGGSVTGAPKIRAMEIIAELEPTARGPYCGSLGYIGFDGSMDTNILIRTLVLGGGWVQCSVGGGIVADSVPEQEYDETWHKAEGMLPALRS